MKECLLSEECYNLEILMTGGMKPEYYIRKRFFLKPSSKFLKNDPYSVPSFLIFSSEIVPVGIVLLYSMI